MLSRASNGLPGARTSGELWLQTLRANPKELFQVINSKATVCSSVMLLRYPVFPMSHIVAWLLADFIPWSDSLWLTLPHFSSQENGIESVFLLKKKKSGLWLTSLYKTSWSQTLLSFLTSIFFIFSFPGHLPLRTLSRMSDLLIRIREPF